jgi:CheY-like chemotaxis protein
MVALAEAAAIAGAPELESASAKQLEQAWALVREASGVSEYDLATGLAEDLETEVADLSDPDPSALAVLPAALLHRYKIFPFQLTDAEICIATANPAETEARRAVRDFAGREVRITIAPPDQVERSIHDAVGPADEAADAVDFGKLPERAEPEGPHILVVDDEASQRTLLRTILDSAGYRITVVSGGTEALQTLRQDPTVMLVTLDYWMDDLNGLRVLQQIRATPDLVDTPVVVVTGADDRHIESSLFEAGADDYVTKPVDRGRLLLRIASVLRRRRLT